MKGRDSQSKGSRTSQGTKTTLRRHLPITELLFLLTGLGGGTGGCLAGAVLVVLVGAVVLALERAGGRVLGAGEGAAVELTVFATTGAVVEGAVFAVLLAGVGSFACASFAS